MSRPVTKSDIAALTDSERAAVEHYQRQGMSLQEAFGMIEKARS